MLIKLIWRDQNAYQISYITIIRQLLICLLLQCIHRRKETNMSLTKNGSPFSRLQTKREGKMMKKGGRGEGTECIQAGCMAIFIQYLKKMRGERATQSQDRKYAKITLSTRVQLVRLVHNEGFSFKQAALTLNMNQSTARMIVRKFEKSGSLFEKKIDKDVRVSVQQALQKQRHKSERELAEKVASLQCQFLAFKSEKQQPQTAHPHKIPTLILTHPTHDWQDPDVKSIDDK